MIHLLSKEINEFINSLVAYISIGIYLIGTGLILWLLPDINILDYGYASLEPIFSFGPYVFLFLIPAITMKSFAEEQKSGTLELLFTMPLRTWDIILAKYFASVLLVLFSLLPTIIYVISVYYLGNPVGNLDLSGIIGSYIGLFLLGCVFVAVGIFCSSVTDNQIVSFILSAVGCYILFEGMDILSSFDFIGQSSYYIELLGISYHYNSMSKGVLDLKDVVYFFGVIFLLLLGVKIILDART
jgi:ABC-2 type transport system permease protein